jgi:RNA polymerase sigma factor (sigma-70 family)
VTWLAARSDARRTGSCGVRQERQRPHPWPHRDKAIRAWCPLLAALDPRDKRILAFRFFYGMTQSQIADEIGMSQMHVSRLLSRTLERLRKALLPD